MLEPCHDSIGIVGRGPGAHKVARLCEAEGVVHVGM